VHFKCLNSQTYPGCRRQRNTRVGVVPFRATGWR